MDPKLAARMFHTLVVMGAALGAGCGPTPPGDQGSSSGAGPGSSGDAASQPGTTVAGDPTTTPDLTTTTNVTAGSSSTAITDTGDAPTTAAESSTSGVVTTLPPDDGHDCRFPQQFKCDDADPPNCLCDPNAPLTPDDCPSPNQFVCQIQWENPPWGCECDPDAPAVPEDCPFPINFNCWEYDPIAIGCRCECDSFGPKNPQNQEDCAMFGPFYCTHEPVACCCQIQLG